MRKIASFIVLAMFCFALTPVRADDGGSITIKSRDGQLQAVLNTGWGSLTGSDAPCQIAAMNSTSHEYLMVVGRNREDIHGGLRRFAQAECDAYAESLNDAKCSAPDGTRVGSDSAVQYELHGVNQRNNMKVGMILTVVDMQNHYVVIITWCGESDFDNNSSDMRDLANSVSETNDRSN